MVVRGAYTLTNNVFNSTPLVSKLKFSGKVEKIKDFIFDVSVAIKKSKRR